MTRRKLEALRNLAERPGTEAEGILAREILARVEAKESPKEGFDFWNVLDRRARGEATAEEFAEAMRRQYETMPTTWTCACGFTALVGQKRWNLNDAHANIQRSIRAKFAKDDRVFYNYWAYEINSTARVTGYVKQTPENGSHPWAWISVKFDHLKNGYRQIPIYSAKGWHLSHEPLSADEARRLSCP